jgi:hypothetical protein
MTRQDDLFAQHGKVFTTKSGEKYVLVVGRYNGVEYDPERDDKRLTAQTKRILTLMIDGVWRSLEEISGATGDPPASVSAQLRHLRKPRFGSYIVSRRHRPGIDENRGCFEYRVSR